MGWMSCDESAVLPHANLEGEAVARVREVAKAAVSGKLSTRLPAGEKRNRKRMADAPRDLAALVVALVVALEKRGDVFDPYRLLDAAGLVVVPVSEYPRDLGTAGRAENTQRSYGMGLLRWFRFLWAIGLDWDRATRVEARDFCRWLQPADKPVRVTGKASPGRDYASATLVHSETVLRQTDVDHGGIRVVVGLGRPREAFKAVPVVYENVYSQARLQCPFQPGHFADSAPTRRPD